jgi:effector-binding domain-containing protein
LRRAELERQVDDNRHRVAQIDARLRLIESEYEMSAQEIVVKHVEPMRIAALSDLIEPDVPEPSVSDEALRVYAGFAVTGDAPGLQIVEMPAAEVASVIHRGPMEGIGQADRALARWVDSHGYETAGRNPRKRSVFLEANGDDQTDWVVVDVQLELT